MSHHFDFFKNGHVCKDVHIRMLTITFSKRTPNWKPKFLTIENQLNILWYIHIMEYYAVTTNDDKDVNLLTWKDTHM